MSRIGGAICATVRAVSSRWSRTAPEGNEIVMRVRVILFPSIGFNEGAATYLLQRVSRLGAETNCYSAMFGRGTAS